MLQFPKILLGTWSIQNVSLSDPTILLLDELGDDIIQPLNKNENYGLKFPKGEDSSKKLELGNKEEEIMKLGNNMQ